MTSLLVVAVLVTACSAPVGPAPSREDRVAAVIARYANSPPALRLLLRPMPKGGDLHNHLDGSVYAEDYLNWASGDGDCIARADRTITPPPCTSDQVPAKDLATRDPKFYQETIDALSMRNFVPGTGTGETSGHDHTFATFRRFGAVAAAHLSNMMRVTHDTAGRDNVNYVEQIADPPEAFAPALLGADPGFKSDDLDRDLKALASILPGLLAKARKDFDDAEARAAPACGIIAEPACFVEARYLYFVLRTLPPQQVFAQMALGFALADSDPRFVGIDLVGPEDDPVALRDFFAHMQMFAFFHKRYPKVKLSLHAGELALGLVPPRNLDSHIRLSIDIAGASRIGHGYDLPYEQNPSRLLKTMAIRKIAVEINLTSNAITPGIMGTQHPLSLYRAYRVPVTLSADDEGVFRIDLTHEYVRAVSEQHLDYHALKQIARNGLEYSFLRGASLWRDGDYTKPVAACAHDTPGAENRSPACASFLKGSEKANQQWWFENRIAEYEDGVLAGNYTPR
jgi:adenosine deaminase